MSRRKLLLDELGRKTVKGFKSAEKTPVIIVLDNVRSLNNIGSVFRTADAFLVEAIYLCGFTATPPHRDIHKTALGATESVDWEHIPSAKEAVERLRKRNYQIIALEQTKGSTSLDRFYPEKDTGYALVFGNEVNGVSQEVIDISDLCVEIPQFGTKHSFNIAVSTGIVLWDLYTKRAAR
ncbi:MAG: TrmH family RNA methyltransferase [Marinilabiliales bacterium]|nr:MAG: TrmH family RNA methyltransferase [Marinilabiliales bacterium]